MTDLAISEVAPYVPPGRPVRRFSIAVGGLAAALLVVAVAGPFRADASIYISGWTVQDDRAIVELSIGNDGRFAIDATGLSGPALAEDVTFREVAPPNDAGEIVAGRELSRVRVEPDHAVRVAAVVVPDCSRYQNGQPIEPVELHVTVELGVERSVQVADHLSGVIDTICNPQ